MTYSQFLGVFLIIPLLGLTWLLRTWLPTRPARPAGLMIGLLALVAVVYTTPWDNYLVAARVWWYDPALVTGLTLGWVPLEEYAFFVLQTGLTGLWVCFLGRRWGWFAAEWPVGKLSLGLNGVKLRLGQSNRPPSVPPTGEEALVLPPQGGVRGRLVGGNRRLLTALASLVWLAAVATLAAGWGPGRYLSLELAWALPPLMLQLAFGADILWRRRRLVGAALGSATLYLSLADWLAIRIGIWTIDPAQSLNIFLGGYLPLEEAVFFFLTNSLLVFGLVLGLDPAGRMRLAEYWPRLSGRLGPLAMNRDW